jgi:hypothetical protein
MLDPRKDGAATSPETFIATLDEPRRSDFERLHERVTAIAPGMAGSAKGNVLAYGRYEYKYASGREGSYFVLGLASNKQYISIYAPTLDLEPYVARLPKANLGRGCVRFKRLADVDEAVIDELIAASAANDGKRIVS